jgi:hypothetical protein
MDKQYQKPFVFVLMSFSEEFQDIYKLGIKPACTVAGTNCERVDEQMFLENILERIYGQIAKADIVVAEMTGRNANVFYEAGYAHGLGKPLILLTQDANDIPFDLKQYPHIVYGKHITTLKEELERKVRWCVENKQEKPNSASRHSDEDDLQRMSQHIINYLNANGFNSMSLERVRERISPEYSDERLLNLIDKSPDTFRRVHMAKGKPGIGLVEHST